MPTPARAVFFDLGGTLFSNRDIPVKNRHVLREAARRLGADDSLAKVGPAYVHAAVAANEAFKHRPYYLHRDLFLATYHEFARRLGREIDDAFIEWFYAAQREVMITTMELRDDCIATLEALRERGLELAIVSNIDEDYFGPMLEHLGLSEHFDRVWSSEAARSCKPHRGIFEHALRASKRSPDEVWFVGDSRFHDVRGARAVGMTTVLIEEHLGRSTLDAGEDEPHHVVGALLEVVDLLDAHNRGAGS